MVWLYKERTLKVGKSWTDDSGMKHPYDWATAWTAQDKTDWGVTWQDDPDLRFDNRFYYAKDVEKSLTDVNEVDKDNNPILDQDGNQVVTKGLKTVWIESTKLRANSFLSATDWYVTRKSETDTAIPSDISKYRTDVRTATKTIEDKINACSKLADFKKLFDVPIDKNGNPTGNAPIYDFPKEI